MEKNNKEFRAFSQTREEAKIASSPACPQIAEMSACQTRAAIAVCNTIVELFRRNQHFDKIEVHSNDLKLLKSLRPIFLRFREN